jgi:hypothetical protein
LQLNWLSPLPSPGGVGLGCAQVRDFTPHLDIYGILMAKGTRASRLAATDRSFAASVPNLKNAAR